DQGDSGGVTLPNGRAQGLCRRSNELITSDVVRFARIADACRQCRPRRRGLEGAWRSSFTAACDPGRLGALGDRVADGRDFEATRDGARLRRISTRALPDPLSGPAPAATAPPGAQKHAT